MMGTSRELTTGFEFNQIFNARIMQQEDHDKMQAPITAEEIQQVIDKWPHNKSAGPHGFTVEFFQKFKALMISDLLQVLNSVMQNPHLTLSPLNDSYIVLIPKVEAAKRPQDFQLISLINSIHKFIQIRNPCYGNNNANSPSSCIHHAV
jgi:hypothetical protein